MINRQSTREVSVRTSRWSGWLVGALIGAQALAGPGAAAERLRSGTKDVTLSGGYSLSHDRSGVERVEGFHLLPHFGYVLSDERGPGWIRGNLELLAEPTLIHFRSDSASATGVGLLGLARWIFGAGSTVRPYIEVGGGVLGGQLEFRQTDCNVNYVFEAGPGLLIFVSEATAVTAGYRYQHLSNGGRCDRNLGLNSSVLILGISHFFP